jgi:hypothetical protein
MGVGAKALSEHSMRSLAEIVEASGGIERAAQVVACSTVGEAAVKAASCLAGH